MSKNLSSVLQFTLHSPALGLTQPPIQSVPVSLHSRMKRPELEADH